MSGSFPRVRRSFGDRSSGPRKAEEADVLFVIALVVGIAIIGIVFVRVQRGLLGPILAVSAAALLVYWLRELRRSAKPRWLYDIFEDENEITLVAEVPGPEDRIGVTLVGQRVEINGGDNFRRTVKLREKMEILEKSYTNGVLSVRLRKLRVSAA